LFTASGLRKKALTPARHASLSQSSPESITIGVLRRSTLPRIRDTFAGETSSPPCTDAGPMNTPPCAAALVTSDGSAAPGEVNSPPALMQEVEYSIAEAAIDLLQSVLLIF